MRFTLVMMAALVGCVEDVGAGKVAAEVSATPAEAVVAAVPEGALALKVDRSRSKLEALGAKVTATHPLTFGEWSGEVKVADGALHAVSFTVSTATVGTDSDRLTQHLKKEDFLFVDRFPEATFHSASVTPGSDVAGATHTVAGDLTIRGVTKRVTFPATVAVAADAVTAKTQFTINRHDFGVSYPGKADDLVQDNVVFTIEFVAPRV